LSRICGPNLCDHFLPFWAPATILNPKRSLPRRQRASEPIFHPSPNNSVPSLGGFIFLASAQLLPRRYHFLTTPLRPFASPYVFSFSSACDPPCPAPPIQQIFSACSLLFRQRNLHCPKLSLPHHNLTRSRSFQTYAFYPPIHFLRSRVKHGILFLYAPSKAAIDSPGQISEC